MEPASPVDDGAREGLTLERVGVDRVRRIARGSDRDPQHGRELVVLDTGDEAIDHPRRVLEIGIGSGLNLPFYREGTIQIVGLDPSPRLLEMARDAGAITASGSALKPASSRWTFVCTTTSIAVTCSQGISTGWADTYVKSLGGQYFLMDDPVAPVTPGNYLLRITVNPPFVASNKEPCPAVDKRG